MLATFDQKNIHAILVSESWLKPCLPSTSYSIPGFLLIRNDRIGCGGGGVAIYLRANIPFTVINTSPQPPTANGGEHLFIEIILSHTKILLGVYYSPSSRLNYFSSFEKLLEALTLSYNHTIIMGDFNTCLLKKDYRSSTLESIVTSCNLHVLPLNATHHFPNSTPSLLDLMIVSSPQHVAKCGQFPADAFSYHDLVFLSYKVRPPKPKPQIILQRNFSGMDRVAFYDDAVKTDWGPVVDASTVDDQISIFNSIVTQLYDKHAPLRAIKIKHLPAPWLSVSIKNLQHKKAFAKTRYKLRPTDSNKEKYVNARNRCNRACRNALRHHVHTSVEDEEPARVWKFLKSLGIGKSHRHSCISNNLDLNLLNVHFSSSSDMLNSEKLNTINQLSAIPKPNISPFTFHRFTECDVKRAVLSISSNAVGVDRISRNMIIPILDIILPILCLLFNNSIDVGNYPAVWKEAYIIPLPKKPNPQSPSEFRPIAILPFLSKVLERLVHKQLSGFLSIHNLLNPFQSGFRPGHSTVTALVKINEDIRSGMDQSQLTVLTLLDFSNAFNTVNIDILVALLRSINISPPVVDWFHSYLFGRRQCVRLEDSLSSWRNTSVGVPQGGVLSPLLFSLFINSISQNLASSYHLYADDLQIYSQANINDLHKAINTVNDDLERISNWCKNFGLKVNPHKTQVIIIGSPRMITKIDWSILPPVVFEGIPIPFSDSVKNLGVYMDRHLSWNLQLESVSRKMFASAASLKRLRNFLPTATKVVLAQSLLHPILDYADTCYTNVTEEQLDKLERLQNVAIRFIFGLRKYDHVSFFRHKLKWLPIRLRRNVHILCLLYNILFNPSSPPYLKERFVFLNDSHQRSLRSSENLTLKTPQHCTRVYSSSFTVQAVRLWNALPLDIRRAPSLNVFRYKVKRLYLTNEDV